MRIPQTRYNFRSRPPESFKSRAAKHLLAQHIYTNQYAHHIFHNNGGKLEVDYLLNGKDGKTR